MDPLRRPVIYSTGVRDFLSRPPKLWLLDRVIGHLVGQAFQDAVAQDERIRLRHHWRVALLPNRAAFLQASSCPEDPPFLWEFRRVHPGPVMEINFCAQSHAGFWFLMHPSEL